MNAVIRVADFAAAVGAVLAAAILVAMLGLILTEIVLRSAFATSTYVADEFVGYGVAATTFLALGHTLSRGSVLRVGLAVEHLGPRLRRVFEAFAALIGSAVVILLMWFFWIRLARSWTRGSVSSSLAQVPLWIPEAVIFAGLALLLLQLVVHLLCQASPTLASARVLKQASGLAGD